MILYIVLQETQELQRKQSWYQQNQVSMTKEDEEEYLNFCSEAMFRIHILEQRLNRFSAISCIMGQACIMSYHIVHTILYQTISCPFRVGNEW